jgi:hypothetical protein
MEGRARQAKAEKARHAGTGTAKQGKSSHSGRVTKSKVGRQGKGGRGRQAGQGRQGWHAKQAARTGHGM